MRFKFKTLNSEYEVDEEHSLIRRLSSNHEPTARQGVDGEWKSYAYLAPTHVGDPPEAWSYFISWDNQGHGTLTSTVTEIVK